MNTRLRPIFIALFIILLASGLSAQSFTASVRGTVADPSGAAVAAAKITITDADRGTIHPTVADEAGRYVVSALPPSTYIITVESPGFKKFVSGRITLVVQQQATVDAQLQVGDIATSVEVEGAAALVNTTQSNLGQVIENKYIISLPNLGRNAMGLTYLTPGVVGSGGRSAGADNNTNFVANGSRNSTSDVLIDGVTVVTVEQNSGITDLKFSPSIDAVQEFKMQTNFFSGRVWPDRRRCGQHGHQVWNQRLPRHRILLPAPFRPERQQLVFQPRWPYEAVLSSRSVGRRCRRSCHQEQDLLLRYLRVHQRRRAPTLRPKASRRLLQRDGDFSKTFNTSGQLMTIFNPIRHVHKRGRKYRTSSVSRATRSPSR